MSVERFATAPEVRKYITHLYFAPVPDGAFTPGEPDDGVYRLEITATRMSARAIYRMHPGNPFEPPTTLFEVRSYCDDIQEQFAYAVWRELSGHVVPYAVHSKRMGGMLIKLESDDEFAIPHDDVRAPAWRI